MSLHRQHFLLGQNFSWINKFVMNLNNNEIPENQLEEYALKLSAKDFCMPIEGKSKTTKKGSCWLFTKNHSDERKELD